MRGLLVVLFVGFLSACATNKPGQYPLTDSERRFFAQVDPGASRVVSPGPFLAEVANHTYPADFSSVMSIDRYSEVYETVERLFPNSQHVYLSAAEQFCSKEGRWPGRGEVVGPHKMRFRCLTPPEWSLTAAKDIISYCESLKRAGIGALQQSYYTRASTLHPCSRPWSRAEPEQFCKSYSDTFNLAMHEQITCADFVGRYALIEEKRKHLVPPSSAVQPDASTAQSLDKSQTQCQQLGFKPKTEKYADCVLRLTK